MKRIFAFLTLVVLSVSAFADNTIHKKEVSGFSGLSVSHSFFVTLKNGPDYSVEFNVDERIFEYCKAEVIGSILYISLNEKGFTKEIKSLIHKKATGINLMDVTVTAPLSSMHNIILEDNACMICNSEIDVAKNFAVEMDSNTSLDKLKVKASKVNITCKKKAAVDATITASEVKVSAKNNSVLNLDISGANTEIAAEGSSSLRMKGTFPVLTLNMSNSAKIEAGGNSTTTKITGKGSANIDLGELSSDDVEIDMTGCTCHTVASHELKLTLQNNAKVILNGKPDIEIVKIANSSVLRSEDAKSK